MTRVDKHLAPKERIAARLRRLGLSVTSAPPNLPYDLVVNGAVRVTLRVAHPGMRRHRVTVGGRKYEYRYPTWHFNFHHHGKLDEQYTDFFVCVAIDPAKRGRDQVFVIPWGGRTGKTFSLHGGRVAYSGQYAGFRDRWDLIESEARRTAHVGSARMQRAVAVAGTRRRGAARSLARGTDLPAEGAGAGGGSVSRRAGKAA